jgi:hypothetical protein
MSITVDAPRCASVIEVAEAMYRGGKGDHPSTHKLPECLDELGVGTQRRYLLLAEAAIECITGAEPVVDVAADPQLLDDLAHQLAFKLNHPMWFADGVRDTLQRYAEHVGEHAISDEVRKAMAI